MCEIFQIVNFLKGFFRTVKMWGMMELGSLKCFVINIDVIAFYLTPVFILVLFSLNNIPVLTFISQNVEKVVTYNACLY